MIRGIVTADKAIISICVMSSGGLSQEVRALVDTGFSSELALPSSTITELGLKWWTNDLVLLADGSELTVAAYEATVIWHGIERRILVHQAESQPMMGMKLLRGNELKIQVVSGGPVTIKPVQRRRT